MCRPPVTRYRAGLDNVLPGSEIVFYITVIKIMRNVRGRRARQPGCRTGDLTAQPPAAIRLWVKLRSAIDRLIVPLPSSASKAHSNEN